MFCIENTKSAFVSVFTQTSICPTCCLDSRKMRLSKLQRSTNNTEIAYWKVYEFWYSYGTQLQSENGPGTFNYDLVQKMGQLHPHIVTVIDKIIIGQQSDSVSFENLHRKIEDILSLQRRHIIQFQSCLDEFNRYLTALGLLNVTHIYSRIQF